MTWNIIWEWFMYEVIDKGDWTVEKKPRKSEVTSSEREEESLKIHKKYLWDLIVPDTDIYLANWSENGDFEVHQEKIIKWTPVDLINTTNEKVFQLLESWKEMQRENNILFDIFGMKWMIDLFNYYYSWTPIKTINDLLLPANAEYLKMMHNFPVWLLDKMNKSNWNPFLAHNILEDSKWDIHFIDTDYRSLDFKDLLKWDRNVPLNKVWDWITKKALKDLSKNRYNKNT